MIKGVILDLDGVYFHNGTKNFIETISKKFKVNREKVEEIYLRSNEMQEYKKGKINGNEYWNFFINELHIKSNADDLLKELSDGYEINPLANKILSFIKKKKLNSIICTNNFKERIDILDKRFSFINKFDFAIFSYDYGMLKPNLLSIVIKETGFIPEEILLIDDSAKNITGAKEMGMNAELCNTPKEVEKILNKYIELK